MTWYEYCTTNMLLKKYLRVSWKLYILIGYEFREIIILFYVGINFCFNIYVTENSTWYYNLVFT